MKNFIIKILYTVLLVMPVRASANPAYVTQDFDSFSKTIQADLSRWRDSSIANNSQVLLRSLVFEQFCRTMQHLWETSVTPTLRSTTNSIYYNPKHSVFVHIVCDKLWWYTSNFKTRSTKEEKTYFLKDDRVTLGIYGNSDTDYGCNPSFGMNDCDVAIIFTDIMQRILNDMFDIKQAAVYGGVYFTTPSVEEKINKFISQSLVWLELCPNNKCDYPKTKNRLEAYFKRWNALLQRLDIINREYIKKIANGSQTMEWTKIDCAYPWKETTEYNIFICGFGSPDRNSLDTFTLMIHNELFFYRLFMAQYMWWIQAERKILPKWYDSLDKYAAKTADIIAITQQQVARTQDATDLSMKMLREMYATFPIHIWLLIYYEDLYRLRKELAKVVTPLYTLYDKLRNVQKQDD